MQLEAKAYESTPSLPGDLEGEALEVLGFGDGGDDRVVGRLGEGGDAAEQAFVVVGGVEDGLAAPAVVKLNGVTTLRLTTAGYCNPNYFMFVPASGITLTATPSAGNTVLSFPGQAGVAYRVFYRTDLTAGNWTLLTTVVSTGAVTSVSDPATGTSRFYKVTVP